MLSIMAVDDNKEPSFTSIIITPTGEKQVDRVLILSTVAINKSCHEQYILLLVFPLFFFFIFFSLACKSLTLVLLLNFTMNMRRAILIHKKVVCLHYVKVNKHAVVR